MANNLLEFLMFVKEREAIRYRKDSGVSKPWTENPILQRYHFPNVFREDDPTTIAITQYYNRHEYTSSTKLDTLILRAYNSAANTRAFEFAPRVVGRYQIVPLSARRIAELETALTKDRTDVEKAIAAYKDGIEAGCRNVSKSLDLNRFGLAFAYEWFQDLVQMGLLSTANDANTWCPVTRRFRDGLEAIGKWSEPPLSAAQFLLQYLKDNIADRRINLRVVYRTVCMYGVYHRILRGTFNKAPRTYR